MLGKYRARSLLALTLMCAQAFLFNAVFFSYGLVLTTFYSVSDRRTGPYLLVMAVSNFLGPLLLGSLFDTVGRRIMICLTYAVSGVLLIASAIAFGLGIFSAWTQTFAWMAIFFFASAGASSAYLTASEIFPLETRALAIAVFYAVGTAVGAALGVNGDVAAKAKLLLDAGADVLVVDTAHGHQEKMICALAAVRALVGDMPLLVPGAGAQGGDVAQAVRHGQTRDGRGLVVSSSRGILYASAGADFAQAARSATETLRAQINAARRRAS